MKKIIFLAIFFSVLSGLKAQYVKLKVSDLVIVVGKNDTLFGREKEVEIKNNSSKEGLELFNNSELNIKATYKLSTNNGVRRSNLKKSAVNVDVNYVFTYKGKKNKVKTERIFYMDDDQKFEEEQTAVFKEGIKNKLITIKYNCVLN
jgi:hypothetical protein